MSLRIGLAGFTSDTYDEIFQTTENKVYDIGERIIDSQGCVYRYFKNGAVALDNNVLVQGPIRIANHMNQAFAAAAQAGATTFSLTPGATAGAKDLYADGFLYINDAGTDTTTEGYKYRVKSHPAITASTAFNITLYDPIKIATTTASQWTLVHNPWNGVIVNPTTKTGVPVGVTLTTVAANYYGWLQTWGPCSVLTDATTPAIGVAVVASIATAGSVGSEITNGVTAQVGIMAETGVSGEYKEVWLTLCP